jgi:hypothetical protein
MYAYYTDDDEKVLNYEKQAPVAVCVLVYACVCVRMYAGMHIQIQMTMKKYWIMNYEKRAPVALCVLVYACVCIRMHADIHTQISMKKIWIMIQILCKVKNYEKRASVVGRFCACVCMYTNVCWYAYTDQHAKYWIMRSARQLWYVYVHVCVYECMLICIYRWTCKVLNYGKCAPVAVCFFVCLCSMKTYRQTCIYVSRYNTYIHTYIHIYIHTHLCTYVRTYIHTHTGYQSVANCCGRHYYIYIYIYIYIHAYIHTYIRIYLHIHTQVINLLQTAAADICLSICVLYVYVCTYVRTRINVYVCMYVCMYIYLSTHTHAHRLSICYELLR